MIVDNKEVKIIPNFPHYAITSTGEVYSFRRNKWLHQRVSTTGYMRTTLYEDKMYTPEIHRLVAMSWLELPEDIDNFEVCHKDGNKYNNDYKNLYWGSHKQNIHDAREYGYKMIEGKCKYRTNPRTYIVYDKFGNEFGRYHSINEVAIAIGRRPSSVAHNIQGEKHNKDGFTFKIIEPKGE